MVGQWHMVTIFRDGMSGWLRMDNDTPISGRSQVTIKQPIVEAVSAAVARCLFYEALKDQIRYVSGSVQ